MDKNIGILVEVPQAHPLYFESQYKSERRTAIIETYLMKIRNLVSLNRYGDADVMAAEMRDRLLEWKAI